VALHSLAERHCSRKTIDSQIKFPIRPGDQETSLSRPYDFRARELVQLTKTTRERNDKQKLAKNCNDGTPRLRDLLFGVSLFRRLAPHRFFSPGIATSDPSIGKGAWSACTFGRRTCVNLSRPDSGFHRRALAHAPLGVGCVHQNWHDHC
jgi:hypothetical protein